MMKEVQTTFAVFLLLLLPFACSSSHEHGRTDQRHTIITEDNAHELIKGQLLFQAKLHGFLLWASMGFLMPVGILVGRMLNKEHSRRMLKIMFYIHASFQTISTLVVTAGAILSMKHFDNSFKNAHQRLGLVLYVAVLVQAFLGFLRPRRGSKGRSGWFFIHWLLGTAVSLMGIINVYTGLQSYRQKTSKGVGKWTAIFTTEISLITFIYLLQEKWVYIQKQGVIIGSKPVQPTDQATSPTTKRREGVNK